MLYNEIVVESNIDNLRSILLKYNVKKIENIEETKNEIMKIYENFVSFENESKTFKITNLNEFFKNYSNIKKFLKKEQTTRYNNNTKQTKTLFRYNDECSNYISKLEDNFNLYDVIETNNTYNLVRNLNIMTILKSMLLETITKTEERQIFENETNFHFNYELFQNDVNCNKRSEVKKFKSLYNSSFENFKKNEDFDNMTKKLSSMTYIEQISYFVKQELKIENFDETILFYNKNCEKFKEVEVVS